MTLKEFIDQIADKVADKVIEQAVDELKFSEVMNLEILIAENDGVMFYPKNIEVSIENGTRLVLDFS